MIRSHVLLTLSNNLLENIPTTMQQICLKVFEMMLKRSDFVMSTDMYQENSIKRMERKRRDEGETIVMGESTKRTGD